MRRFHSLTGALALGLFLLGHLWAQARALAGTGAYESALSFGLPTKPWLVLEVLLVYLPLLFHAGYGLAIARQRALGLGRRPYRQRWAWWLQRLSGVAALLFIGYHFWQFRWQVWQGHLTEQDFFPVLCATLSATTWGMPLAALGYLVGSAACIAHFCNGLSGFFFRWGITRTRRAVARTSLGLGAFGFALFAYACTSILYFATGSTPLDLVR
jgi:succinate dehydrogenase/fumarate reductase cytochrome b subunit (b558 family)